MISVSDEDFQRLIDDSWGELPKTHVDHIKNVAILFNDEPTPEQRAKLELLPHQSLYGLYEGVPLSQRQGLGTTLPDRITLFKLPLLGAARNAAEAKAHIKHTLWHEIAHYYGLDHDKIHALERGEQWTNN